MKKTFAIMRIGAQILSLLKGFKDTIAVMKVVFAFISPAPTPLSHLNTSMWRDLDILVYEIHLECLCKQVPYNQI